MEKSLKSAPAAVLCGATVFAAPPAEILVGPMTVASPLSVRLAPGGKAILSPLLRSLALLQRILSPGYYRNYGYDPSGAIFAGAALRLLGAARATATTVMATALCGLCLRRGPVSLPRSSVSELNVVA
jgi:hypothetical protein